MISDRGAGLPEAAADGRGAARGLVDVHGPGQPLRRRGKVFPL